MLAVGTCGYSYKDWVGPVYPPRTPPARMLDRYAHRFAAVEIDASYYRVPSAATFASMARRTPEGFRFTAKLPGTGTHVPEAATRAVHDDVRRFRENLTPLIEAKKFACALAQFPSAFRPSEATHAYLCALREVLAGVPMVAEFRHRDWQTHETLALLRALDVGFVNVDEPQFSSLLHPSSDASSAIAYVRFHGRSYRTWWKGTNATRYDYLYTAEELAPWADRLVDLAADPGVREVFAFFNNHARGQAVRNAEMLEAMLAERLPADVIRRAPGAPPDDSALELPLQP